MSDAVQRASDRANAFVAAHGGELERRAAAHLRGSAEPAALATWLARSWTPPGEEAAAAELRRELGILLDVGVGSGPAVEQLCMRLSALQSVEGRWGEGDGARFETGLVLGHLSRTRCARSSVLDRAADWLAADFEPGRVQGFAWAAVAAHAQAFANLAHEDADAILQWCGRELERGFRAGRFSALETARVLVWCDAAALPGAGLDPAELREGIVAEQRRDGGWPGAWGRPVDRTWGGLVCLSRLA